MAAQVQQNSSNSTSVMELEAVQYADLGSNKPPQPDNSPRQTSSSLRQESHARRSDELSLPGSLPAPTTATESLQRWNYPRKNTARIAATFWAFLVMGANDAAYGVWL